MTAATATLGAHRHAEFLAVVDGARSDLDGLARASEAEVDAVSHVFKVLAGQADTVLQQAAAIVSFIEKDSMGAVLSGVQSLCLTVKDLLGRRLEAAANILDTLQEQEELLTHLTRSAQSQEAIARHLRALSVLTNVEVAHLGNSGGNFQLLAHELSTFSKSLGGQTLELARDTEHRQQSISGTRKELAASLPRLRNEMTLMDADIAKTLRVIDAGLSQQTSIPEQFRRCAEGTSVQIAGVIAAIQAHDITRQQIEHVQHALQLIATKIAAGRPTRYEDLSAAFTGLKVQICQLKTIQQTVSHWTSQVRACMAGIQQLSASDVVEIGPTVLRQEQELSSELARIEQLQQQSQEYSGRMQGTLGGLASLVELVNAHLKRSQAIRDRLQILMFNSLIEAQRLGDRGAVVSAIASLIKEVSGEWNAIANQSRLGLNEILRLVRQTTAWMEVFSEASCRKLREDQARTATTLTSVRSAAAFVAEEAGKIQALIEDMHGHLGAVADTGSRLEACFGQLHAVLERIENFARQFETSDPQIAQRCDAAEVEQWLSGFYTTEIERKVMSAALYGTALPAVQESFAGNAVELF